MINSDGLPNIPKEAVYISQLLEQSHVSLSLFAFFDQFQRGAQVLDGIIIGKECDRLSCGFAIVINGSLIFIGESKVICKQTEQSIQTVSINGFHRFTHTSMKSATTFDQNGFVNSLLGERVAEGVFNL